MIASTTARARHDSKARPPRRNGCTRSSRSARAADTNSVRGYAATTRIRTQRSCAFRGIRATTAAARPSVRMTQQNESRRRTRRINGSPPAESPRRRARIRRGFGSCWPPPLPRPRPSTPTTRHGSRPRFWHRPPQWHRPSPMTPRPAVMTPAQVTSTLPRRRNAFSARLSARRPAGAQRRPREASPPRRSGRTS